MRRSTRARAKKVDQKAELRGAELSTTNGSATPTRSRRARASAVTRNSSGNGAETSHQWSGSSSPLSSISTPASTAAQRKRARQRTRTQSSIAQQNSGGNSDEEDEEDQDGSGDDDANEQTKVSNLLLRAAESIRDGTANGQPSDNEGDEQVDDVTGRSTRSRAAMGKRRRDAGSPSESPSITPASKRRAARGAAVTTTAANQSAKAEANGRSSLIRGRAQHQSLEMQQSSDDAGEPSADGNGAAQMPAAVNGYVVEMPTAQEDDAANGYGSDESSDDEEVEKDMAGEAKIDKNGYMQGGREFICPIFRSPFRRNRKRQYVLTMDCCRYMGARDSYMLFKQHSRMRRVETTQEERDLLADRQMIPKVTRFRPIALITARTAFREFGARIIKNGRYIVDDYWEEAKRREAKHAEGTLIANMTMYHTVMAAQAAGVTPGSTRKARKPTPLRSPTDSALRSARASTPTRGMSGFTSPLATPGAGVMVSSWAQLEAQQRMAGAPMQPSLSSAAQLRAGGLTMAHALQQQQIQQQSLPPSQQHGAASTQLQQVPQLQLLQQAGADDGDSDDTAKVVLSKPVFRKLRAPETAEAAFESAAAVHRSQFSEDHGFVDGMPLIRSLANSWPRATPLSGKFRQKRGGAGMLQRSASGEGRPAAMQGKDEETTSDDLYGPMAFASSKMAREFNSSVRLWREDNGCTWVDPHTGIRQVPANLQPTTVCVERVDVGKSKWRHAGRTKIEPLVSFTENMEYEDADDAAAASEYPLALLPGQFQATFPVHRTRFGQTYQQSMQSYSYYWMRLLTTQQYQQQQQRKLLMQQQQVSKKKH
ncbi:hypothetical protein H4R24_005661 [Coemansia sp. RSA 988]|nr:hypothetical protein H4R24_005661 [Coemansia sp. RSA 988]